MTSPFDLRDRVAVVTGANTGIGQGMAVALATAGADIALVGRSSMADTAGRVAALGRRALEIRADLSTIAPVQEIVDRTVADLGGLDILVNNAGIIRRADALDFTEADWDAVIDTNLKSLFFLCQSAGRHMIQRFGAFRAAFACRATPRRNQVWPALHGCSPTIVPAAV
jgi:2-deoxy-D-gluconate 3-dehydrogenase